MLNKLKGVEIPLELKRVAAIPSHHRKPLMVIYATDPSHKEGVIYNGVGLISLSTSLDGNGKIKDIAIAVDQEGSIQHFGWYPDGGTKPKDKREVICLEVYWEKIREGVSSIVGIGEKELNDFLSKLPKMPDKKVVEGQMALEARLSRIKNETTFELSRPQYRV